MFTLVIFRWGKRSIISCGEVWSIAHKDATSKQRFKKKHRFWL